MLTERKGLYLQQIEKLERIRKECKGKKEQLKKEAKDNMKRIIAKAKADYETLEREVEKKHKIDENLICEEIAAIKTETESIERTVDWSETVLNSAKAGSLLEALQLGPKQHLIQDIPPPRKSKEVSSFTFLSSVFNPYDYINYTKNCVGAVNTVKQSLEKLGEIMSTANSKFDGAGATAQTNTTKVFSGFAAHAVSTTAKGFAGFLASAVTTSL